MQALFQNYMQYKLEPPPMSEPQARKSLFQLALFSLLIFAPIIIYVYFYINGPIGQMMRYIPNDIRYISRFRVQDINQDDLPEVLLEVASDREFRVYYYTKQGIREVPDLSAWTWSNSLFSTSENVLVLCAWSHSQGTGGIENWCIYRWNGESYVFERDLWRDNAKFNDSGTPIAFDYYSSPVRFDLFEDDLSTCERISKAEYDAILKSLDLPRYLNGDFWVENPRENSKELPEMLAEVKHHLEPWRQSFSSSLIKRERWPFTLPEYNFYKKWLNFSS